MRISFLGDIMCEKPLQKELKKGNKNITFNLKKYYNSDYVIGNLETIFAGRNRKYTRDLYSFNTPDSFCEELKYASIDCVTTANNHCLDRGIDGLIRTSRVLKNNGIKHVGTREKQNEQSYLIVNIGGKKVGFLAYTYGTNYSLNRVKIDQGDHYVNLLKPNDLNAVIPKGMFDKLKEKVLSKEIRVKIKRMLGRTYNHVRMDNIQPGDFDEFYINRISKDIQKLKNNVDYLFAYLHTGGQLNLIPGSYSEKICHFFYNQGVKCVIASHPHIVQRVEPLENGVIAYSLGNFLISPNSIYLLYENRPDLSIVLHFDIDENKIRCSFSIIKVCFIRGRTFVKDCFELYEECDSKERENIVKECKQIYNVVFNNFEKKQFKMNKEYFITEFQL